MSKPYSFVPLLKRESYRINDKKVRGKIELTIKVLNALHVSQTNYNMNEKEVLYKMFYKVRDKYAIPGTSIKGMVRNIAEMVSYSCIGNTKDENKYIPNNKRDKCKTGEYCMVCDIFGSMGKRSKIKVGDFIYEEGTGKSSIIPLPTLRTPKFKESYTIKGIAKGYKIYNHGVDSIRKEGNYNCECFLKDSIFKGTIIYEDIDQKELELLCYSIGLSGSFNHKLGYGKPAYYGSIEVNCNDVKYIEYAKNYEVNVAKDIKSNMDLLNKNYSFKNAKTKPDYDELTY